MTAALKEKLKLSVFRTEKLIISTFGAGRSEVTEIEIVQLKIKRLIDGGSCI